MAQTSAAVWLAGVVVGPWGRRRSFFIPAHTHNSVSVTLASPTQIALFIANMENPSEGLQLPLYHAVALDHATVVGVEPFTLSVVCPLSIPPSRVNHTPFTLSVVHPLSIPPSRVNHTCFHLHTWPVPDRKHITLLCTCIVIHCQFKMCY